jgi:succinyl-diaminopimelate desuccinylase
VGVSGGVAGNVIPDECVVTVNFRYAPDRTEEEAVAHVREVFADCGVTDFQVVDHSCGALPGLSHPAAAAFIEAVGATPRPKYGWTDVSRFSALGIPAVNYGPGNPHLAHKRDERVETAKILAGEERLRQWLTV